MPVRISPLVHIEIVVRDAEEAYRFLNRAFGARKTQVEFAKFLTGPEGHVVHVALGGVVLQFVQPKVTSNLWADFLAEKGPGVLNITFTVDNIDEAVKTLEAEGAPVLLTFPLDWAEFAKLLPPGSKFRQNQPPVHMIGSQEKVGFRLELAEAPIGSNPALYDIR